jgi:DNA-binding beta-propeller fold protein YncE
VAHELRAPGRAVVDGGRALVAVADTGNGRVLVVSLDGTPVAEHGNLLSPEGLGFLANGDLLVCEPTQGHVLRIAATGARSVFVGGLGSPVDVAVAADDSAVVADAAQHRIRRVRADGQVVVLSGSGAAGLVDGQGSDGRLSRPSGVAIGAQGVFVADAGNCAVRVLDRFGRLATLAGRGAPGLVDGARDAARLDGPLGVAPAPDGSSVYVADTGNDRVRLWSGVDGALLTIGVTELHRPGSIDVLRDGRLVVADTGNDRVVVIDLATGSVHPLVG